MHAVCICSFSQPVDSSIKLKECSKFLSVVVAQQERQKILLVILHLLSPSLYMQLHIDVNLSRSGSFDTGYRDLDDATSREGR